MRRVVHSVELVALRVLRRYVLRAFVVMRVRRKLLQVHFIGGSNLVGQGNYMARNHPTVGVCMQ